ncbi:MAG: hypothetical protein ACREMY_12445 [bacterium]
MPHVRPKIRKKTPKRVLALPGLEHAKSAVLSSLTSRSGQRIYDHAIREFAGWYCSEPRLAFNRTVVLRLRRTCARLCHLAGGELEQIQFLLGHVSVQTTERYLGCKQKLRCAVNDRLGIEPDAAA